MDAADGPFQDTASDPLHVRLDTLPPEILSLIANGTDTRGHPILDPRCRFHLAQVSRALRACVSCPSEVDAARLARHPGATAAWVEGRGASIASAVQAARSNAMTPREAARGFSVPSDPHRGEVAALLATAPAHALVRDFDALVESLIPTATTDWFVGPDHITGDGDAEKALARRARACRNVAGLTCRLERSDVALALLGRHDVCHMEIVRACLDAAIARDDDALVGALFCLAARHEERSSPHRRPLTRALFHTALAAAASEGKINVMRCLMTRSNRESGSHLAACWAAQDAPSKQGHRIDHTGCAFAATGLPPNANLRLDLMLHAAAHNRVDVFVQFAAEGYDNALDGIGCAVVYGSTDVADFAARQVDCDGGNTSQWTIFIMDLLVDHVYHKPHIETTSADRLARGMAWLRARGVIFRLEDIVDMAVRLDAHPDLVGCVLSLETPPPDPSETPFLLGGRLVSCVEQGRWPILSRVIIAYSRATDEAQTLGRHTAPVKWWSKIAEMVDIARTANGLALARADKRTTQALAILYRIATLCGRVQPFAGDAQADAGLAAGPLDATIDPASWTRWCNPVPLYARCDPAVVESGNNHKDTEADDGDCEIRQQAARMLTLLADAGLVVVDESAM